MRLAIARLRTGYWAISKLEVKAKAYTQALLCSFQTNYGFFASRRRNAFWIGAELAAAPFTLSTETTSQVLTSCCLRGCLLAYGETWPEQQLRIDVTGVTAR